MAWKWISRASTLILLLLTACTTTLASLDYSSPWKATESMIEQDLPTSQSETPASDLAVSIPEVLPDTAEDRDFTWAATSTPAVIGLSTYGEGINPLTGLSVDNIDNLNRRPLMIKVSNYPRGGRPHAGLSYADLVFEYYIGEQMNRFLAIYYGENSPQVGPLRSGRLIDPQLASMYGGILVYGSADPKVDTQIINTLQDRAYTHLSSTCPPICGQDTHSVSGVFVDSGSMTSYAVKKGTDNTPPDLSGFLFDAKPPSVDNFAVSIGVEYSFRNRGEWRYDPGSGKYLRWIEADDQYTMIPLVDRVNGDQLSFSNVIILYAVYVEYAPTLHDVLVWNNLEGQPAIVFRDGVAQEGIWKVPDHEQPLQLYNSYGLPIALKPGNTWIVFLGQSSDLIKPVEGQWEFYFDLP